MLGLFHLEEYGRRADRKVFRDTPPPLHNYALDPVRRPPPYIHIFSRTPLHFIIPLRRNELWKGDIGLPFVRQSAVHPPYLIPTSFVQAVGYGGHLALWQYSRQIRTTRMCLLGILFYY